MAPFKNGGLNVQEYVYDFAVDGGAVSSIDLSTKDGFNALPEGAIVRAVTAKVLTACTSGGSATVEWGNSADTDGYSGTAIAVASLTALAVFSGYEDNAAPGALIAASVTSTGGNSVTQKRYNVTSASNTQNFIMKIAVATLTAGKIVFLVEYYYPKG